MNKKTKALKLALEALKNSQDYKQGRASLVEAVEDIEEALAQPEPAAAQPQQVPYIAPSLSTLKHSDNCRYWDDGEYCTCGEVEYRELQYWKAKALAQPVQGPWRMKMNGCKTKCADCPDEPAQPEQEPVATVIKSGVNRTWISEALGQLPDGTYSLYTTPPKELNK